MKGSLTLVATPIGNLGDLSRRGIEALSAADLVLCEDTRVTSKLLSLSGIKAKVQRCDDHTERRQIENMLTRLQAGENIALVSDAGTPLISDPGYSLVKAARDAGHNVTATPGPAAPILALILSGLPTDRFYFGGFLPSKSSARQSAFAEVKSLRATTIFFDSPRRIAATLRDALTVFGPDRDASTARELTKKFEQIQTGTVETLEILYRENTPPKGELVLMFGPAPKQEEGLDIDALLRKSMATKSLSNAAKEIAQLTGRPKSVVYGRALEIHNDQTSKD
ncbi:MAG: 16S rRNA (cytidine(1402)-2'-O)-methyltransferase [Alphaproteobacteria bacterium]